MHLGLRHDLPALRRVLLLQRELLERGACLGQRAACGAHGAHAVAVGLLVRGEPRGRRQVHRLQRGHRRAPAAELIERVGQRVAALGQRLRQCALLRLALPEALRVGQRGAQGVRHLVGDDRRALRAQLRQLPLAFGERVARAVQRLLQRAAPVQQVGHRLQGELGRQRRAQGRLVARPAELRGRRERGLEFARDVRLHQRTCLLVTRAFDAQRVERLDVGGERDRLGIGAKRVTLGLPPREFLPIGVELRAHRRERGARLEQIGRRARRQLQHRAERREFGRLRGFGVQIGREAPHALELGAHGVEPPLRGAGLLDLAANLVERRLALDPVARANLERTQLGGGLGEGGLGGGEGGLAAARRP